MLLSVIENYLLVEVFTAVMLRRLAFKKTYVFVV